MSLRRFGFVFAVCAVICAAPGPRLGASLKIAARPRVAAPAWQRRLTLPAGRSVVTRARPADLADSDLKGAVAEQPAQAAAPAYAAPGVGQDNGNVLAENLKNLGLSVVDHAGKPRPESAWGLWSNRSQFGVMYVHKFGAPQSRRP